MPTYRAFRNTDPPAVAAIWRSRTGHPGLAQPVSADLLEQFVLGKLYFDYEGLVLAFEGDRPVGFAHAGFGPAPQLDRIATEKGVTCVVMVRPECLQDEVASGLLEHCESYLQSKGATELYGGGTSPLNPFYTGLYGGSELPGVLDCDGTAQRLFSSHGYREIDHTFLLRLDLDRFHPPVDRRLVQFRRRLSVEEKVDPPSRSWWEACTVGDFDLTRFDVSQRGRGPVLASATFRGMEPTSTSGRAVGLLDVQVDPSRRRQGLGTFLLGESFRQLTRQGIAIIEAQSAERNPAATGLFGKLGLEEVQRGTVFRKEVA